jgi:hypothetical protein
MRVKRIPAKRIWKGASPVGNDQKAAVDFNHRERRSPSTPQIRTALKTAAGCVN